MAIVISDTEAKANLAANLNRMLKQRELRQAELARMIGEHQSLVSRISNGRNMPGGAVLARIAEALDVSIDRLLSPPPEEIPA